MEWITAHYLEVLGIVYVALSLVGQAVGLVNTPKAARVGAVVAGILAFARKLGIGARFADEGPTKKILPGQGATGEVVVATESIK